MSKTKNEIPKKRSGKNENPAVSKAAGNVSDGTYAPTDDGSSVFIPDNFDDDQWTGQIYDDPRKLPLSVKSACFHNIDAKGNPTGVIDNRIYQYIIHTQHIFVCGGIPYIYQGGYYHMDLKGTMIKSLIKACCLENFIRSTTTDRIFKLFLQDCEIEKTPEDMNGHTGRYINFENGMYDVISRKVYNHNPSICSVNQIPWEYDPEADHGSGTEIENFLRKAIPDDDDREMLLEYAGLCCSIDVHQQKMLIICGDGGTGKSTVINLVQAMVGKRNTSNVAMSKLSKDFQAIRMMGKLLNSCADLEIDALDDVTTIKKLIGEDAISDSYKGKDVISFDNYAKLLFSTNELPVVRNEKTEGFYRRLLILAMNEKPERRDANLFEKLKSEMPYFIHLCMEALHRLYKRGYILESENSVERIKQLRNDSDTVEAFVSEELVLTGDPEDRIDRGTLFDNYTDYCKDTERQAHTKNNFFKALRNKGFIESRTKSERYFCGMKIRDDSVDDQGFMKIPEGMQPEIPFPE